MAAFFPLAVLGCLMMVAWWVYADADGRAREGDPVSVSVGKMTVESPTAGSLGA
jgi:hypothetical protein